MRWLILVSYLVLNVAGLALVLTHRMDSSVALDCDYTAALAGALWDDRAVRFAICARNEQSKRQYANRPNQEILGGLDCFQRAQHGLILAIPSKRLHISA